MDNMSLKIIEYLTVLELPLNKTITVQEVKESFRKLSHIYHPDVANERYKDGKKFIFLQESKDFLIKNIDFVNKQIINNFNSANYNQNNDYRYWHEQERKKKETEELKRKQEEEKRKAEERRKQEEEKRKAEADRINKLKIHIDNLILKSKELINNFKRDDYYEDDYSLIEKYIMSFISNVKNSNNAEVANELFSLLTKNLNSIKTIKDIQRLKKMKKNVHIILSCIATFIILLILSIELVIPSIKYDKAKRLEENGDYLSAIEIYDELEDFKDASQKIVSLNNKIKAEYIEDLILKKMYSEAISFARLNNFRINDYYDLHGGSANIDEVTIDTIPAKIGAEFISWEYIESFVDYTDLVLEIKFLAIYSTTVYHIEYILNCDYDGELVVDFTVNDEVDLPVLSKLGYEFDGWLFQGKYVTKIPKGTYTDVEVQAMFTPIVLTISFDEDGGSLVNDIKVNYDGHIKYPKPTKPGYVFNGWMKDGQIYEPKVCDFFDDVILKASWSPADYLITLVYGNGQSNSIISRSYGDKYNINDVPLRAGYTFDGWYLNNSFNGEKINLDTLIVTSSNHNLYAKWDPIVYSIIYELDGATNNENNKTVYTITDEVVLFEPTKQGYTFDGWYSINHNKLIDKIGINTTGDIKVKAMFHANNYIINVIEEHYLVSFDLNGGESEQIPDQIITSNSNIIYPNIPTRNGYCFKGWYTTKSCQHIYDFQENIYCNLILYAGWEKVSSDVTSQVVDGRDLSMTLSNFVHGITGNSKGKTIFFPVLNNTNFQISLISDSVGDREVIIKNVTTNTILFEGEINIIKNKNILIDANQGDILSVYSFSWSDTKVTLKIKGLNTPLSTGVSVKKNTKLDVKYNEYFNIYTRSLKGYSFVGYFDENNVQATDSEGKSLSEYFYTSNIILHEVWTKE